MSIDLDKVKGALYGQAIGDALGLPGEFKGPTWMRNKYGSGDIHYEPVVRTVSKWESGEFSDDTEQALCILDAWIKDKGVLDPSTVAEEFCKWAETNGRGMGNHTWNVLGSGATYLLDPIAISKAVWEDGGKKSAPNGAVMRTAAVGILDPMSLDRTEEMAVLAAQTTHYDPRCVAGSVAVSVAIAALVTGRTIHEAIQEGLRRGMGYDGEVTKYAALALDELNLAEGIEPPGHRTIGYTYKCMGAGFWALREAHGEILSDHYGRQPVKPIPVFREVLQRVLMAGGDTDTNGAVAGAMVGAAVGFGNIPKDLVEGLHDRAALDKRLMHLADFY